MNKSTLKVLGLVAVLALSASPAVAELPPYPGIESVAGGTVVAQATVEGTWSTRTREDDDGDRYVRISMEMDDNTGNWGWRVEVDELSGLNWDQFDGDVDDARFELRREAGTMVFAGRIRDGRGAGTFEFVPNATFVSQMDDMGFDLSEKRVFQSAVHDITTDYVRDLQSLGYTDIDTGDLFSFAIHGVSPQFIRDMNGLGYNDIPAGKLVTMRIHGVSPNWVREVRAAMGGR